jgi:long-chain acyl-CoA synthetase
MSAELRSTLEALKTRFKAGAVDRTISYYLSLGDGADEKWTVTLSPTSFDAVPGKPARADCVLKTSAELFVKLVNGAYKPGVSDFLTGKIKTSDIDLLQRLQKAFGF